MLTYKEILMYVFLIQCSVGSAKISPDYIVPCKGMKSDCLKRTVQEVIPNFVKGIPSIGINSTDPLYYHDIDIEFPGGLKLVFSDGVLTGLRKCIVDNVSFDSNEADVDLHCDITIKGKYKTSGKVLIISIEGDGDAKIKISNFVLKGKLKFADTIRDGVTYFDVKDYKVTYVIKDKIHFALTNLFNGNPVLSQTVLTFLNANWKEVVDEFGGPLFKQVVDFAFKYIQNFFSKIPKDELIVL